MQPTALDLTRTITPETVLDALSGRIGAANGLTAVALVRRIAGRHSDADERTLRECVVRLRREGHPVCADPVHGYFLAARAEELDATYEFLFGRAMTSLEQVSAMRHLALPDLRGQLGLSLPMEPTHDLD